MSKARLFKFSRTKYPEKVINKRQLNYISNVSVWVKYGKSKALYKMHIILIDLVMVSETVDFLTPDSLNIFKSWTGELRYLPNIKLRKYTKQGLEALISGTCEASEHFSPHQMEEDDDSDAKEEDSEDEEMSD